MVLLVPFLYVCDNLVIIFIESMLGIKENDSDAIKLLHLDGLFWVQNYLLNGSVRILGFIDC